MASGAPGAGSACRRRRVGQCQGRPDCRQAQPRPRGPRRLPPLRDPAGTVPSQSFAYATKPPRRRRSAARHVGGRRASGPRRAPGPALAGIRRRTSPAHHRSGRPGPMDVLGLFGRMLLIGCPSIPVQVWFRAATDPELRGHLANVGRGRPFLFRPRRGHGSSSVSPRTSPASARRKPS
jgi:hypothetical protein